MNERFDTFRPPPAEPDPWEAHAPAAVPDEGGALDPHAAAELLAETMRGTERELDLRPPFLTFIAAVVMLVAYGAIWLSVRHQHPYVGPHGPVLGVVYGTLAVWIFLVVLVTRRQARGVGGRSSTERKLAGIAFAPIWLAVYVFQGALYHAGASKGIAYGIYPATGPFIIVGSAAAAYMAAKENRGYTMLAIAGVAVAVGAAFTGPVTAWAVVGVGVAALLVVYAGAKLWVRRG